MPTDEQRIPASAVPPAIFRRLPLPCELAQAIGDALDAEAREADPKSRIQLRLRTRGALEAWLEGRMTTSQLLRALHVAGSPDDAPPDR
jgi:hypothetical protein